MADVRIPPSKAPGTVQPIAEKKTRRTGVPAGDKAAVVSGILLTLLVASFFMFRMADLLSRDRALKPVPASTPTPPLKRLDR